MQHRLFTTQPLLTGLQPVLTNDQIHYLLHVLRIKQGDAVLLFNGCNGEWRAKCVKIGKKSIILSVICQEQPQSRTSSLLYCFSPLKYARLDYMVQKAVEMGASILQPIMTRYTQVTRFNFERMHANVIKAAEQCGLLFVPECRKLISFDTLLATWEPARHLIFCDEAADARKNPLSLLNKHVNANVPLGLIIGPEGGFSRSERKALKGLDFVIAISLGPRILRADTAAVAALALINACND